MRILFVTHRFPFPPNRGGKIRPFNIIRHLSKQHEVVVASLARSMQEAEEASGIRDYCYRFAVERVSPIMAVTRMVLRLPTLIPSSMGYFFSPALGRRIRTELRENHFDLIFVHCSSMAQYVDGVRGIPKLLDFGDMDSQKWLEYCKVRRFPLFVGYHIEGAKLQRAEARLARKFDLCTCTTPAELKTLESLGTGAASGWFPNGVDAECFTPGQERRDEDLLCFVGRLDYYPNQEAVIRFCRDMLPLIRSRRPGVKLIVVGANPSGAVRKLETIPGVTVTGWVQDVRPHVRRSSVAVVPLRIARGTQNKILETMAMGVPTVVSEAASRGVDALPGEHFLTGTTAREFADSVLKVLENPQLHRELAEAGRQRVLTHHSWEASMKKLDPMIQQCLENSHTRS